MSITDNQRKMLKLLDIVSYIYKKHFIGDKKFKDQLDEKNGFLALKVFLNNYAYTRQGAPNAYSSIAIECISKRYDNGNKWHMPTNEDAKEIWKRYKQIAKEKYNLIKTKGKDKGKIKVNQKINPLNEENGIIIQIVSHELSNIALYIKNQLINKRTKEAYNLIKRIGGCGEKITSFYLRDIADIALENNEIENESEISDLYLLQPMDTWLNQTFEIIFQEKESKTHKKQEKIVNLCKEAEISTISFNQGAWILGSQLAGNYGKFQNVLKGKESFQNLIEDKIKDLTDYVKILKDVIRNIQN